MGTTLGARLDRVGRLGDDEVDPHPKYEPGWRKELGYEPVELIGEHPLLDGLDRHPVFRHAHTSELKNAPAGFVNLARTDITELQYLAHETLPLAGTQFHPEWWTDEHPAGRRLIANFCTWAGVSRLISTPRRRPPGADYSPKRWTRWRWSVRLSPSICDRLVPLISFTFASSPVIDCDSMRVSRSKACDAWVLR